MPHFGTLRQYRFAGDTDDIRGTNIYGTNDEVLGEIDDVIFDHSTGDIQYAVIDTGGWLSSNKFLVPADRISGYKDTDDFFVDLTKEQIERFPEYDEKLHENQAHWDDYAARYHDSWTTTGDVLHREGSTNVITPDASEMPAVTGDVTGDFTPDRLTSPFTDTAPKSNKLRMRPSGTASRAEDTKAPGSARGLQHDEPVIGREREESGIRDLREDRIEATGLSEADMDVMEDDELDSEDAEMAETSAYGDASRTARPGGPVQQGRSQRWSAFEDNLRRNRVDITASCRSCGPAKDRAA